jgi:hypothetical protein
MFDEILVLEESEDDYKLSFVRLDFVSQPINNSSFIKKMSKRNSILVSI